MAAPEARQTVESQRGPHCVLEPSGTPGRPVQPLQADVLNFLQLPQVPAGVVELVEQRRLRVRQLLLLLVDLLQLCGDAGLLILRGSQRPRSARVCSWHSAAGAWPSDEYVSLPSSFGGRICHCLRPSRPRRQFRGSSSRQNAACELSACDACSGGQPHSCVDTATEREICRAMVCARTQEGAWPREHASRHPPSHRRCAGSRNRAPGTPTPC